jgi:hypothetical protein
MKYLILLLIAFAMMPFSSALRVGASLGESGGDVDQDTIHSKVESYPQQASEHADRKLSKGKGKGKVSVNPRMRWHS